MQRKGPERVRGFFVAASARRGGNSRLASVAQRPADSKSVAAEHARIKIGHQLVGVASLAAKSGPFQAENWL